MTDTSPPARPARHLLPRIPLVAAAAAALTVGVAGYIVGHIQGANGQAGPASSSSACASPQSESKDLMASAKANPSDEFSRRTLANLIVQNPACFDPSVVAGAQTLLDQSSQGSTG